jgi:molybdopterin-guanine dinucleotide biosynthesis protein A
MHPQSNISTHFGDVLDAVGTLSAEEQLTLVEIVARRLAEQGRKRVAASVQEARREFAEGHCRPVTVDELKNEILS